MMQGYFDDDGLKWNAYYYLMSVTPVVQQEGPLKRGTGGGLSRQGSFGSSEQESYSGENNLRGSQQQLGASPKRPENAGSCSKIVQNIYFQIFITFLTVITLLLYDIKTIVFSKNEDFAIGILNCIFCAVFLAQIGLNIKTEGYYLSFFFFLDLISTITILFDVDFVTDAMFGQSSSFNVSSFVAKSKASRVAARAVRVVKIFRLARVAKLYKSTQKAKELNEKDKLTILEKESKRVWSQGSNEHENIANNDEPSNHNLVSRSFITRKNLNTGSNLERYQLENDSIKEEPMPSLPLHASAHRDKTENTLFPPLKTSQLNLTSALELQGGPPLPLQPKESQISKILTQDTIKKIVIIILLIMIEIPLLNIDNFQAISTQWDYTVTFVANGLANPNISLSALQQLIEKQINSFPENEAVAEFICMDSPFSQLSSCSGVDFSSYRSADLGAFSQPLNVSAILMAKPSLTLQTASRSQSGDQFSIFLDYSQYNSIDAGFSIATTTFICLTIVYLLSSFSGNINDLVIVPIQRMLRLVRIHGEAQGQAEQAEQDEEQYETKLVQQAIVKIKDLMQTIYGPLGNDLVQERMLNNKSISTNLMDSLRDSLCVVAFCRLSHITKLTELLGEDAFGLINEIALIVHNAAFRYGGYCTKVLDQGFLIIFKVGNQQLKRFGIDRETDLQGLAKRDRSVGAYLNNFCDFTIYFALKTLARIVKEPKLFKYRNNQNLLRGFGGIFNIEMNFAFTLGWCSEAVIGSSHKIDPLFLGEEVNQLVRAIRISQNYPSSILIAQSLHKFLSPGLMPHIRSFQVVKFQEEKQPIRLYFVDYDPTNVSPSLNMAEKNRKEVKDLRTKKAMNMLYLSGALKGEKGYNAASFIARKKELSQILRKLKDDTRRKKYEQAFQNYIKGNWLLSKQFLQGQNVKNDTPSQRLLSFLQSHSFNAPADWRGYRRYHHLFNP